MTDEPRDRPDAIPYLVGLLSPEKAAKFQDAQNRIERAAFEEATALDALEGLVASEETPVVIARARRALLDSEAAQNEVANLLLEACGQLPMSPEEIIALRKILADRRAVQRRVSAERWNKIDEAEQSLKRLDAAVRNAKGIA